MQRVAPVFDWLVDGAPGATTAPAVLDRVANGLRTCGVPLDRVAVFVRTLHPTVLGRAFYWEPGAPVRVIQLTIEHQRERDVSHSPVALVSATQQEVRRQLLEPLADDDFEVLHELRAAGFTDFAAFPATFLRGETHAMTYATRAPDGFSDDDLAELRHIMRPFTRVAEIFALHRTAANLLTTYVGHNSGERILAGRIFKGDIETLRAIIWFSDLRDFTEMSLRLPPRAVIDVLNDLFECQVAPIEAHGGEVLKFIGDGLLAIFPFVDDAAAPAATARALDAATAAFAALAVRNAAADVVPIRFGLALHLGELTYGNIGGSARLDFTAIGPAVNLAARLETLTSKLARPIVVSSAFAAHATHPLEPLGEFALKGVPGLEAVFAPIA